MAKVPRVYMKNVRTLGKIFPLWHPLDSHRSNTGVTRVSLLSPLVHTMAVATTEADEAVASSVFVQIMGIPLKKLLAGVILVIFGHFASSDFKVWLRWCTRNPRLAHVSLPGHSEGTREIWPHGTHTAGWPGYELGVHQFDPWASLVSYVWVQCAVCLGHQ